MSASKFSSLLAGRCFPPPSVRWSLITAGASRVPCEGTGGDSKGPPSGSRSPESSLERSSSDRGQSKAKPLTTPGARGVCTRWLDVDLPRIGSQTSHICFDRCPGPRRSRLPRPECQETAYARALLLLRRRETIKAASTRSSTRSTAGGRRTGSSLSRFSTPLYCTSCRLGPIRLAPLHRMPQHPARRTSCPTCQAMMQNGSDFRSRHHATRSSSRDANRPIHVRRCTDRRPTQ